MDREEELGPIVEEVEEVVALVWHGAREILREHVILQVVHHDVVEPVDPPRDAEEIAQDVREIGVCDDKRRRRLEEPFVLGVVQTENEALNEKDVHQHQVRAADGDRVGLEEGRQVVLEHRRRDDEDGQVPDEVDHESIAFVGEVWLDGIHDEARRAEHGLSSRGCLVHLHFLLNVLYPSRLRGVEHRLHEKNHASTSHSNMHVSDLQTNLGGSWSHGEDFGSFL